MANHGPGNSSGSGPGNGTGSGPVGRRRRRSKGRRPPVGSQPGVLVFPSSDRPTRLQVIRYDRDRVDEARDVGVESLPGWLREGAVTWIEVEGLGHEPTLRRLGELFHIHPLGLADIVNVPQRPRADPYDGHELVICRQVRAREGGELELEQVSVVVGPNWVLSFHEGADDLFDPVRARIRGGALVRSMHADYLAYALVDTVVDGYYPIVESISEDLEALEDEVVARPRPDLLSRIHRRRRELLVLHRVVRQQRDAVGALMRVDHPQMSAAVRVYLRDTYDHALHVSDTLESLREVALGLMDVYLSTVANRTNEVMKVLTVMSTIFIPLTFVVGVYGMNFDYMPELRKSWGYPAVMISMGVLALGMLASFWRRGWLGRQDLSAHGEATAATRRAEREPAANGRAPGDPPVAS